MPVNKIKDFPSIDEIEEKVQEVQEEPRHGRSPLFSALLIGLILIGLGFSVVKILQDDLFKIYSGTGSVTGHIYDDQGNPIAADVFIFNENIYGKSNASGWFELKKVPAGEQMLVTAYRNIGREYRVVAAASKTVNMGALRFVPGDFSSAWAQQ
jgi:hypothetical protein